ncbi:MAG: BLUF domain-containing protein [Beijerinckiaceae bacterium]|nr:BLUF domain-containing protein [Beijerinckiaceae bacterium]
MTSQLYRLVYHSRNFISGTPEQVSVEVNKILESSQRNNLLIDVTGALIFNAGMFAQVLEGARNDLEATFERIQRDERHGEVEILAFDEASSRGFPSWSMGFVGHSCGDKELFTHIGEGSGFEAKRLEGEHVFRVMRDLAIAEETRAA